MSLDEINRIIDNTTKLSEAIIPKGFKNLFDQNKFLSPTFSALDKLTNSINKQNSIWGIGSIGWFSDNSFLDHLSLPNNFFNVKVPLNVSGSVTLSKNIHDSTTAKILNGGFNNMIAEGSWNKVLQTQHKILNQLAGTTPFEFNGLEWPQSRNVFNTLGSLSAKIASQGLVSYLDNDDDAYIENSITEVGQITNSILQNQHLSITDLNGIYELINKVNLKIDSINKSEFKTFAFWLSLLSLLLTFYALLPQKTDTTDINANSYQHQIIDLRNKLISAYHNNVSLYSSIRTTNKKCKLLLKPRLKSLQVMILLPNKKLSIINARGKWCMATCLDDDSLPVTGWILKKYLNKSYKRKKN